MLDGVLASCRPTERVVAVTHAGREAFNTRLKNWTETGSNQCAKGVYVGQQGKEENEQHRPSQLGM